MNKEPLRIKKRGEDGHRVISIRIPIETMEKLDKIAFETNRSRNEIINIFLEYGVKNVIIEKD
ncbi:MAG: ribbon-helix-helix protein, CopG family [Clostridia bacterium]|nr:ribbon-helix-helix protein, CopG family [Clostridia bacterium]